MKKVLIADDENHVCRELQYIIAKEENLKIVKTCSNGTEALEQISKLQPDIVFLDIEMPGIDGIQIGYYLKNLRHQPYVIFVTAYAKFAVEAFKVGARGYILKPFSDEDVQEQLRQALKYLMAQNELKEKKLDIECTKIPVDDNGKYKLVEQNDIVFAYANDRAVFVKIKESNLAVKYSLLELEELLKKERFLRCHRNYIVNVNRVKEVIPWFSGTYMLVMDDNTNVPVSRANTKHIRDIFRL